MVTVLAAYRVGRAVFDPDLADGSATHRYAWCGWPRGCRRGCWPGRWGSSSDAAARNGLARRAPGRRCAAGLVLYGIGGIGKTTLAAELIRRMAERDPDRLVVVIGASGLPVGRPPPTTSLVALGRQLLVARCAAAPTRDHSSACEPRSASTWTGSSAGSLLRDHVLAAVAGAAGAGQLRRQPHPPTQPRSSRTGGRFRAAGGARPGPGRLPGRAGPLPRPGPAADHQPVPVRAARGAEQALTFEHHLGPLSPAETHETGLGAARAGPLAARPTASGCASWSAGTPAAWNTSTRYCRRAGCLPRRHHPPGRRSAGASRAPRTWTAGSPNTASSTRPSPRRSPWPPTTSCSTNSSRPRPGSRRRELLLAASVFRMPVVVTALLFHLGHARPDADNTTAIAAAQPTSPQTCSRLRHIPTDQPPSFDQLPDQLRAEIVPLAEMPSRNRLRR